MVRLLFVVDAPSFFFVWAQPPTLCSTGARPLVMNVAVAWYQV
jgi:hypothetical protein